MLNKLKKDMLISEDRKKVLDLNSFSCLDEGEATELPFTSEKHTK